MIASFQVHFRYGRLPASIFPANTFWIETLPAFAERF